MRYVSRWPLVGMMFISLLLGSCGTEAEPDAVTQLEAKLEEAFAAPKLDPDQVRSLSSSLAEALINRAASDPTPETAPEDLFQAAELYEQDINQVDQALATYAKLLADYPNHDRAAYARFKQGYLYHNILQDLPKAEAAYTEFLTLHPDHSLAPSAQEELNFLGVSPEEWLQQKLQQAADSARLDSLQG